MGKPDYEALEDRLDRLLSNGVVIHDRRQVFIGADVVLEQILPGTQLFPGTRIGGSKCILGRNSVVGSEGPATLDNVALDDGAEIASGFITNSVLLRGSRIGSAGHIRACTILEEEASTAHAVGLKQTILMSFTTLGSLINFCDGIVSGGRSRSDHTEIGTGVINFNFTPWGARGDKATATLLGDVYRGVFLNNDRIFLGGLSGVIGPGQISFGACTVAGQVIRQDVGPNTLFSSTGRNLEVPISFQSHTFSERKHRHNLNYISNLIALRAWYSQVRLARIPDSSELQYKRMIIELAMRLIDGMVTERIARLKEYLTAFSQTVCDAKFPYVTCPIKIEPSTVDHIEWIRTLEANEISALEEWLREIGNSVWPTAS